MKETDIRFCINIILTLITTYECSRDLITPAKCPALTFGDYCAFVCHCEDNECKPNGACRPNFKCAKPYFAYRCQIMDLAPLASETNFLNDYNEDTCGGKGNHGPWRLKFDRVYKFSYAEITFREISKTLSQLKYDIKFTFKDHSQTVPCGHQEIRELSPTRAEYRCSEHVLSYDELTLEGYGLEFVCSFHISRGRNIAKLANITKWFNDLAARLEYINDGILEDVGCFKASHYDDKIVKLSLPAGVPGYLSKFTLDFSCSRDQIERKELPTFYYNSKEYEHRIDLPMQMEETIREITISHPAQIKNYGFTMSFCELEIYAGISSVIPSSNIAIEKCE
ncbi:hypothetical protein Btru_013982 [Bulinus truncatus]|nr:hypothetical protein Btru_013982 [Bulinus truncatus]